MTQRNTNLETGRSPATRDAEPTKAVPDRHKVVWGSCEGFLGGCGVLTCSGVGVVAWQIHRESNVSEVLQLGKEPFPTRRAVIGAMD